jgi:quercetin dioxygenase-like cupin family protein
MNDIHGGRLVVTGHAPDGTAIIVSDAPVPETNLVGNTVRARFLWARDDVANFPDDGSKPEKVGRVPGPGGCRFSMFTVAAGATDEYHAFVTQVMGDLAEPAHPGFHRTPTLDFVLILDGELFLEVDRGEERILRKGDSAVLNGVRHRWHNRGGGDATLLAVMIGARNLNGERL